MVHFINGLNVSEEEKKKWYTAASQFRLPYWDWARKQPYTKDYGLPQICTQPTWPVVQPGTNGKTILIENPLTGFSNPKRNSQNQRVPMGDKSMGANAIKDDDNLPVSVSRRCDIKAHPSSGASVLAPADMESLPMSHHRRGSTE